MTGGLICDEIAGHALVTGVVAPTAPNSRIMRRTNRYNFLILTVLASISLTTMPARAIELEVTNVELPGCDMLLIPAVVDELGDPAAFPLGERIAHMPLTQPGPQVCDDAPDNVDIPNPVIEITNLQAFNFTDLWYVGPDTFGFTNVDGLINNTLAFKIDSVGLNRPLIFESITANNIFEPGETWRFVVQDYTLPTAPDAFFSPGIVGLPDDVVSIVAVPGPGAAFLFALGLLVSALRRGRSVRCA
jgi:hypothetical protein